ncbi:ABC-type Fe3+-hydroxamate transport system substrate-binding protein [Salibacterium salarium]|uniref:AraC family transcriptional regulator n=1 Tax=Salibacterium salarium TaxID=284579 RepID=UPI00278B3892|nr:ABC transporter substrate-binding protein [Salibacterium salarium]MDQ0297932.1 ABC-type Fe3+-hydroxamate transport system substrate-binding protein [Salibacterium salarium]
MIDNNKPVEQGDDSSLLENLVFRLRGVECITSKSDWKMEQQYTDSYILLVMVSGEGNLTMASKDYRLRPHTVYVCHPGETLGAESYSKHALEMYLFRFALFCDTDDLHREGACVKKQHLSMREREIPLYFIEQLKILCESVYRLWQSNDKLERFRCQLQFQECIFQILKNRYPFAENEQSQPSLETVKDYIDCHYDESLTIEQLARMVDISPKYFVDLFKKTYGISTMDYLTEVRINQAKNMMIRSNKKLRDIAYQVGFNDEFYFSRKFKKEVSMTPTVYIKSRRRKIASYTTANIGQLLAIKVMPYAAPLHPKWAPYYYRTYRSDIPVHLSAYRRNQYWQSNIETLFETRPETIISMDNLDVVEKEKLEKVAPVFYVPSEKHWKEQLQLTADFLGEQKEAKYWLQRYERHVKAAENRIKQDWQSDRFLVIRILKKSIYAMSNRSMAEIMFQDLKLTPAYKNKYLVYNEKITLEQLARIDADHLLIMVCQEEETLAYWEILQHSIEWNELKAVQKNKAHLIPSDPWLEYSPYAHWRIVDELINLQSGNSTK